MEADYTNNSIGSGFVWKLLERFGVQGIQFILQIILARMLAPELYGVLSMMIIFTTLANVFIQSGFNTALIQNKDVTEEDYSSVFWVSLGIAVILYGVIFFCAPLIAQFYDMPDIVVPLRVLAFVLFPGTLNSIQLAKVSREMNFKQVFFSNIAGIMLAGISGIVIAFLGGGLWALVVQNILNITTACTVMLFTVKWHPVLVCNFSRVVTLFRFGWKYLASGLLDSLSENVWSLIIGKKFNSEALAHYNRGNQFPEFLMYAIIGALQSVMLPALSANQDDISEVKRLTKNSVILSAYVIFPMMAGLAGISHSLIQIVLTDKWLPCVPFLQMACICFACYPIYIPNLQAISALGRSDIFLKLELIKKAYSAFWLLYAIFFVRSPIGIAVIDVICCLIALYVNSFPNKKLIGYSFFEQIKDVFPSLAAALIMLAAVLFVGKLSFAPILVMVLQVITGVMVYVLISIAARLKPFYILCNLLKETVQKSKHSQE